MGTYVSRPDGLFDVSLGDGQPTLPMALSEQQLRAAGHQPAATGGPAPELSQPISPAAVAGPGAGLEDPRRLSGAPPPASFFGPPPDKFPSIAEQQGTHGAPPPPAPPPPAAPPQPVVKGTHETPRNVPNAAPGAPQGRSFEEFDAASTSKGSKVDPGELVSYRPPSRGTGGAAEAPAPVARGGGGGGPKIPKDEINPGLKDAINNDSRAQQYQEAAFQRYYGETDDRLAREEMLAKRQADIDAANLQRAGTDEEIRRKHDAIDKRDEEAKKLTPRTAQQVWEDTNSSSAASAAIFLSFLPGALGRGGQALLQHLRGVVNDEVASQQARYENAKGDAKEARNDYARAMAIYGSPEAAALDIKMRSWALADNLQKTKAEAIGTEAALAQANINSEGIRLEQEKAKQELKELERIKALRAAQAASGGGQAAALARQGIVKIGKDFYTVDKKSGQWVPLDKAAELAGKARGGPTAQKADSVVATIDVLGDRLAKKPKNGEVFAPENQNIVTRGVRSAVNAVAGERTVLPGSAKQREEANEFDQIKNDLMSQTSVINGQGAMSDPEAKRATEAIGQARTWGELQRSQKYLRDKAAAAASAYDGGEEQPAR